MIIRGKVGLRRVVKRVFDQISNMPPTTNATIVALVGDLGAGKTTLTQEFAKEFGVRERVKSPTFILMSVYEVPPQKGCRYRHVAHIDCYRLESPAELVHLGFATLLKDREALVVIEWADHIRALLPPHTVWIRMEHGTHKNERVIHF